MIVAGNRVVTLGRGSFVVVGSAVTTMAVTSHHKEVAGEHEDDEGGEGDSRADPQRWQEKNQGDGDEAPEDVEKSVFHWVDTIVHAGFVERRGVLSPLHVWRISLHNL